MKIKFLKIDHNVKAVETEKFGWTNDQYLYWEWCQLWLEESVTSMYY